MPMVITVVVILSQTHSQSLWVTICQCRVSGTLEVYTVETILILTFTVISNTNSNSISYNISTNSISTDVITIAISITI